MKTTSVTRVIPLVLMLSLDALLIGCGGGGAGLPSAEQASHSAAQAATPGANTRMQRMSATPPRELPNGPALEGVFTQSGAQNACEFAANLGEGIQISVVDISPNGILVPQVTVISPSGRQLGSDFDDDVALVDLRADMSGTYTVLVRDSGPGGGAAGRYRIRAVRAPGANEYGALPPGGTRRATAELGFLHSYTVTAGAGEGVQISVGRVGNGDLTPHITLYRPNGERFASTFGGEVALMHVQVDVTGTYTIVVRDALSQKAATGTYDIHFARAPGARELEALIPGGQRLGEITVGDLDSFTFVGKAGDKVLLEVSADAASGKLAPHVTVYRPTGAQLSSTFDAAQVVMPLTLDETGTYTVVIRDTGSGSTGTGRYSIAFSAPIHSRFSYAALGDSYSSGEGVMPYRDLDESLFDGCHRSSRAYPTKIRLPGATQSLAQQQEARFDFFACSGAITDNIRADGEGQYGEPPQLDRRNAVGANRDLVTLTIGGNDAQFARILAYCLAHRDCDGLRPFGDDVGLTLGDFAPLLVSYVKMKVQDLLASIRAATPNAATVVLGYPLIVSGRECTKATIPGVEGAALSESEQSFLRDANKQLNRAIAEAAAKAGVHYVSVEASFEGHGVCAGDDDWIFGMQLPFVKASFHPTARGQAELARAVNDYLESIKSDWPHGYLTSGLPRNPPPGLTTAAAMAPGQATGPAAPIAAFGELRVTLATAPAGCPGGADVVVPGQRVAVQGSGFLPGQPIALSLVAAGQRLPLGIVNADAEGLLDAVVTAPPDLPDIGAAHAEALGTGRTSQALLLTTLVRLASTAEVDADADGVPDVCDNCPSSQNTPQVDTNTNGIGDACEPVETEADRVFDWAEFVHPTLFPTPSIRGVYEGYDYRHYPKSGNYLATRDGRVIIHNGRDWNLLDVGDLSEFLAMARAAGF